METILAITQLFMVISYTPYNTNTPIIEVVSNCTTGRIRATDINWGTLKQYKKSFAVTDKYGERLKCSYNK